MHSSSLMPGVLRAPVGQPVRLLVIAFKLQELIALSSDAR
jgi:hypothetical protein